jgi:hypothetical protein
MSIFICICLQKNAKNIDNNFWNMKAVSKSYFKSFQHHSISGKSESSDSSLVLLFLSIFLSTVCLE